MVCLWLLAHLIRIRPHSDNIGATFRHGKSRQSARSFSLSMIILPQGRTFSSVTVGTEAVLFWIVPVPKHQSLWACAVLAYSSSVVPYVALCNGAFQPSGGSQDWLLFRGRFAPPRVNLETRFFLCVFHPFSPVWIWNNKLKKVVLVFDPESGQLLHIATLSVC